MACNNDGGDSRRADRCKDGSDRCGSQLPNPILTIDGSMNQSDDWVDLYGNTSLLVEEI